MSSLQGYPQKVETSLTCSKCRIDFKVDDGIADFSDGEYYDERPDEDRFDEAQLQGLRNEHSTGLKARATEGKPPEGGSKAGWLPCGGLKPVLGARKPAGCPAAA